MKGLLWMSAGSLASVAVAVLLVAGSDRAAVLLGMLGPLVVAGASWVAMERTYRSQPAKLTGVMVAGFGLKLVFVGVYVSVMLGLLAVSRLPFVISFTSYFIALYAVEAMLLSRLLASQRRSGSPEL